MQVICQVYQTSICTEEGTTVTESLTPQLQQVKSQTLQLGEGVKYHQQYLSILTELSFYFVFYAFL